MEHRFYPSYLANIQVSVYEEIVRRRFNPAEAQRIINFYRRVKGGHGSTFDYNFGWLAGGQPQEEQP